MLRTAGVFEVAAEEAADLCFRQCSLSVTAHDLAVMGATLGHAGRNPLTGSVVFGLDSVRETLSVMFTCGPHDGTGDWACRGGRVRPETFTHGSSAQRVRWLRRGLETGRLEACDTFGAAAL
jgi:glutaminase